MAEKQIGKIIHYYDKIQVGIVDLKGALKAGDTIRIIGHDTDFTQKVESMQIEHENVDSAKAKDVIGIKVARKVHENNVVCKITEEKEKTKAAKKSAPKKKTAVKAKGKPKPKPKTKTKSKSQSKGKSKGKAKAAAKTAKKRRK